MPQPTKESLATSGLHLHPFFAPKCPECCNKGYLAPLWEALCVYDYAYILYTHIHTVLQATPRNVSSAAILKTEQCLGMEQFLDSLSKLSCKFWFGHFCSLLALGALPQMIFHYIALFQAHCHLICKNPATGCLFKCLCLLTYHFSRFTAWLSRL